jgi:hypothetical protein
MQMQNIVPHSERGGGKIEDISKQSAAENISM